MLSFRMFACTEPRSVHTVYPEVRGEPRLPFLGFAGTCPEHVGEVPTWSERAKLQPALPVRLEPRRAPRLSSFTSFISFASLTSFKSFPLNLFADPHPLTLLESYRFKNSAGK